MKIACLLLIVLCSCTAHQRGALDSDTEVEEDVVEEQDTVEDEPEADSREEDVLVDETEEEEPAPECVEDVDCDDSDDCTVDTCEDQECVYSDVDADGDGYVPMTCGGTDCDDSDEEVTLQECEGVNPCCDGCTNLGCWYDETTGYYWQGGEYGTRVPWEEALDYCAGLSLGGMDSWELPSISVLRTIIRGCPTTEDGGACEVTNSCLGYSCRTGCGGCDYYGGPSEDGSYHDPELSGLSNYWSASLYDGDSGLAWLFSGICAGIMSGLVVDEHSVRCVNTTGE